MLETGEKCAGFDIAHVGGLGAQTRVHCSLEEVVACIHANKLHHFGRNGILAKRLECALVSNDDKINWK